MGIPRLRADLDAARDREAAMAQDLRAAAESIADLSARLAASEAALATRTAEVAALSRLLLAHEQGAPSARARAMAARLARLAGDARAAWGTFAPLRLRREMAAVRRSGVLDEAWYLRTNPDVAASGIGALRHYVKHGIKEGRPPNPGRPPPAGSGGGMP